MKQTDFLIRVKHTRAFSKESIALILKAQGGIGVEVTVLDSEDAGDSNDPRNYSPYIGH